MGVTATSPTYRYITTGRELALMEVQLEEYVRMVDKPKIAIDTETWSPCGRFPHPYKLPDGTYEGYVATVQIGLDPTIVDRQYILDNRKLGEELISRAIKPYLEDPKVMIIGQNLKYDWKFFKEQFGITITKMRDLMLISQILNAGDKIKHNLGSQFKEFLEYGWFKDRNELVYGEPLSFLEFDYLKKEMQISDWSADELTERQLLYAADDVGELIFKLYRAQMERLDHLLKNKDIRSGVLDVIMLECDLIPAFAMMEMRGVGWDHDLHKSEVLPYLEEKRREAKAEVDKYFSKTTTKATGRGKNKIITTVTEGINIASYRQLHEVLDPILGELPDTGEKTLRRHIHKHPSIKYILQYKKAASLLSKFGEKFDSLMHEDGRLHPSWFQIGSDENAVDTGRSSCKQPNMMQIPSREKLFGERKASDLFRKLIRPSKPGRKIITIDYSQIEPRGAAQVTKDATLIEAFNSGEGEVDLHSITGPALMGLFEEDGITPRYPQRGEPERDYVGKTANLALGYGIGPKALATFMFDNTPETNRVIWSVEEAKEKISLYYNKYSGVKECMDGVLHKVSSKVEPYQSLAPFRGRKPIMREFTDMGRFRSFCLTDIQEKMAKSRPEALGKYYKAFRIDKIKEYTLAKDGTKELGEDGKPLFTIREVEVRVQNEYSKRVSAISREAYNFKIQGMCADVLKRAVLFVDEELRTFLPEDQGIIAVVHDEIVFEVEDQYVERVVEVANRHMVAQGKIHIKVVPVITTTGIGPTWGDAK